MHLCCPGPLSSLGWRHVTVTDESTSVMSRTNWRYMHVVGGGVAEKASETWKNERGGDAGISDQTCIFGVYRGMYLHT